MKHSIKTTIGLCIILFFCLGQGVAPTPFFVYPEAFGAKCDGTTDDTAAVQKAISIGEATKNIVVLAKCTYRTTLPLIINSTVTLRGAFSSTITLDTPTSGSDIIDITGAPGKTSGIQIEGIAFARSQADASGWAINADLISGSMYRDLFVFGNGVVGNGFNFTRFSNVSIHNSWVQNVTGNCIGISGTGGTQSQDFRMDDLSRCDGGTNGIVLGDFVTGMYVFNSIFYNISTAGIIQTSTNPANVLSSYHIVANDFDTIQTAVSFFDAIDIHLVGNRFGYNNTGSVYLVSGLQVEITGNNIIHNGGTHAIRLGDGGCTNYVDTATIAGNVIDGGAFGVSAYCGSRNISITANTFTRQTSAALDVSQVTSTGLPNNTVSGNMISSSLSSGPFVLTFNGWAVTGNSGVPNSNTALFSSTASSTMASASDVSCFGTGYGGQTLPSNTVTNGTVFRLSCAGFYTTPAGNSATITVKIKISGVQIAAVTTPSLPASAVNLPWSLDEVCTVRSIGASAAMICAGGLSTASALSGAAMTYDDLSMTTPATFSTQSPFSLDATMAWSTIAGGQTATGTLATLISQ